MGHSCCGQVFQRARSFLTKEERIEMLKEYQDETADVKEKASIEIKNSIMKLWGVLPSLIPQYY